MKFKFNDEGHEHKGIIRITDWLMTKDFPGCWVNVFHNQVFVNIGKSETSIDCVVGFRSKGNRLTIHRGDLKSGYKNDERGTLLKWETRDEQLAAVMVAAKLEI